jgi:hypothetical protein
VIFLASAFARYAKDGQHAKKALWRSGTVFKQADALKLILVANAKIELVL